MPLITNNPELKLTKKQQNKPANKYFLLHPHCFVVNGENGSAIYDLYNEDLYNIDKVIGEILTKTEENISIDIILKSYNSDMKYEIMSYLKEFETNNIGAFYEQIVVVEKLKPYFSKHSFEEDCKLPLLYMINIEIESQCNLQCRFCTDDYGKPTRCFCSTLGIRRNKRKSILKSKWREVIEQALMLSAHQIVFVGGEPLLAKNTLIYLIDYIRLSEVPEKPPKIVVRTNCSLMNKNICKIYKKNNVSIETNIYSHEEDLHDWITQVDGSWKRKIENIRMAVDFEIPVSVKIEILKQNQDNIPEISDFLRRLGIKDVFYDYVLTKNEQFYPEGAVKNYTKSKMNLDSVNRTHFFHNQEGHPCWDRQIAITTTGNILPCIMARNEKIGNIMQQSIIDVIKRKKMDKYWNLTKDYIEGCEDCEYRYACFDCRPRESIDGSLTAKNKYCLIQERRCTK